MSEVLSQEEIDALLSGNNDKMALIAEEKEALSEISNIAMNVISNSLLNKLKKKVSIKTKKLTFFNENDIKNLANEWFSFSVDLLEGIEDKIYFLLNMADLRVINDLLLGGDGDKPEDFEEGNNTDIILAALKDALPDAIEAVSKTVDSKITSTPPEKFELGENKSKLKELLNNKKLVKITFQFEIGNVLKGELYQLMPVSMSKKLVSLLINTIEEEPQKVEETESKNKKPLKNKKTDKNKSVTISPVKFPEFGEDVDVSSYDENIEFILDVPLKITVELGGTSKPIKDILNLNVGSIIELDKLAEDYVDVLVNGKLIARGEVIVIDENFGVRIIELYTNEQNSLLTND